MICYGRMDQFDLEVKVQDKKTMVRDTSSGGAEQIGRKFTLKVISPY
jgi:hypothetical protein